jgi:hypothetical protein
LDGEEKMMDLKICRICNHPKENHTVHIGPDWTGQKIKHVGCKVIIKKEKIDFMDMFGIGEIGHSCSCDGFKPNTKLKRAIKKYLKFLKEHPATSDNLYRRHQVKDAIKRFRKSIKENPKNLLHWQLEELKL